MGSTGGLGAAVRGLRRKLFGGQTTTDYTHFVVVCRSRVGSNLLVSYLDAHPAIEAHGELFSPDLEARMLERSAEDPIGYLEKTAFRPYPPQIEAAGFKLFYYHARDERRRKLWDHLHAMTDLRVVHLVRRNVLRTHVSRLLAGSSDRWTKTQKDVPQAEPTAVVVHADHLAEDFEATENYEDEARHFFRGHAFHELAYEDLVGGDAEPSATMRFLGVEPLPVETALERQNPEPLRELIANYDELKHHFRASPWERFFDER